MIARALIRIKMKSLAMIIPQRKCNKSPQQ